MTTGDATAAVEAMSARGAGFRRPPPTYYKMVLIFLVFELKFA